MQEAQTAIEQTNGYKLDKAHVFAVNMFDDFEKYMKVPDEWVPLEIKPYTPAENMLAWLTDDRGRDQFVIRFGSDTEVFWNDARQGKPDPVYHRSFWTESFVQWSPLGTYLATIHRQGAAVWGGAQTFNRLTRYIHPQVGNSTTAFLLYASNCKPLVYLPFYAWELGYLGQDLCD